MYFSSRHEAGYRLAQSLLHFREEPSIVVALGDGAVQLGLRIATELSCPLALLLSEEIELPGEGIVYGELNQSGRLTPDSGLSSSEMAHYYAEYHGIIEDQKRVKMSKMNQLMGAGGTVEEDSLRGRNVILVSDGLRHGGELDAAADFLKPLNIIKLVIAVAIASVDAVDRAHVLGDELHILGVTDNFLDTDHYYDTNDVPEHEEVIASINSHVWTQD